MQYTLHFGPDALCIDLTGHFTFSDSGAFRLMMKAILENGVRSHVVLNMTNLSLIDSTALRLLMSIFDNTKKIHCTFEIVGAQGQVLARLEEAAQFNSLCLAG